ncbi:MAG: hypothetical protein ACJ741_05150 [Pyrinomonadaceae bacterium]
MNIPRFCLATASRFSQVCHSLDLRARASNLLSLLMLFAPLAPASAQTASIRSATGPATLLISELRTSGPAGQDDDFVEIYNNSDSLFTVPAGGYGLFKMGAACTDMPTLVGVIPATTQIKPRGHFLFIGTAYSLANYGGTGAATGDATLSATATSPNIEADRNVALFTTIDPAALSSAALLDAVGFTPANTGGNCDLLREGTNLAAANGSTAEHSFVRDLTTGYAQDTNDNAADLFVVSTMPSAAVGSNATPRLGAPGPENLASPVLKTNAQISSLPLDATQSSTMAPNRVRDSTANVCNGGAAPSNCTFGTLSIRRRFTNNTGADVTRLRFRVVQMTTLPGSAAAGVADVRLLTSPAISGPSINDPATCGAFGLGTPCSFVLQGTTLETPPAQSMGGGYNSTARAGVITTGVPLHPGASIVVQFLLGVQKSGSFTFFVMVKAVP